MKYILTNISVSGVHKIVHCSATVEIQTDAGVLIHSDSIRIEKRTDAPSGWYAAAKIELLAQARAIINKFNETFTEIAAETGKTNVDDIMADVKSYVEGGL